MRTFDPQRFGVVQTGQNLLLRGNIPLDDQGQFSYDAIRACVQVDLGEDLNQYELLDVSLIDNVSERGMWSPEVSAFGVNPDKYPDTYWPPWLQSTWVPGAPLGTGTYHFHGKTRFGNIVWWPIEAEDSSTQRLLDYPGWDLNGLVDSLIEWLKAPARRAVYVHCTLGADRTGAAIGSYMVKTANLTADEAIEAVTKGTPSGVAPSPAYQNLVRLYAAQFGR